MRYFLIQFWEFHADPNLRSALTVSHIILSRGINEWYCSDSGAPKIPHPTLQLYTHQIIWTSLFYSWVKPALLSHRAISLPAIRPLETNKRLMMLLVVMDHGCPDTFWYSWRILKTLGHYVFFKAFLSLVHRHLPSQALKRFLISFHPHFLTKSGKVRGWRHGEDAFTQFITGHPSLLFLFTTHSLCGAMSGRGSSPL